MMANWRKQNEKFERYLEKKRARDAAKSPEELKRANEAWSAEHMVEISDEEEADLLLAEAPKGRLVQALADSIRSGGLPCCNSCFAPVVRDIQTRQQSLRARYGTGWHGHVKFNEFLDGSDERVRSRAWDAIRWLEERGFVKVGKGFIAWVG